MCGIVGIIDPNLSAQEIERYLHPMNGALTHRGPDDAGLFVADGVGLAMRRLAILDLSPTGHQPMRLEEAGLVIVYNGELYNFKEIRAELEACGHHFCGSSDTEVLLHAYQAWGAKAFEQFNGMFALAIWHEAEKRLVLARDRVGEKPLFLWQRGSTLVFASELKALLRYPHIEKVIDREALFHFLVYNSAPWPKSVLDGVVQVKPATLLTIEANGSLAERTYWQMPPLRPDPALTEAAVLDQVHELVVDSVRLRLRSDVPVGVFLSGGVDSSLIAALAASLQPGIQTFSIGYRDPNVDESRYAAKVAEHLKTEHHTILVEPTELDIAELTQTADDPSGSATMFPYLRLAQFARQHVSVALAGDGGDEFFCGYVAFRQIAQILNAWQRIPGPLWNMGARLGQALTVNPRVNPGLRTLEFATPGQFVAQYISRFPLEQVARLVHPAPQPTIPLQYQISQGDYSFPLLNYRTGTTFLHDTVLKTSDRSTMHHSLEGRLPLTDHRLIELASRIPPELQFKDGIDKYVLKQLLWRYVPRALVDRPKVGFSFPTRDWVFRVWAPLLDYYLAPARLAASGALNVPAVSQLVEVARQRRRGYDRIVWNLLIFQLWWLHVLHTEPFPTLQFDQAPAAVVRR